MFQTTNQYIYIYNSPIISLTDPILLSKGSYHRIYAIPCCVNEYRMAQPVISMGK